MAAKRTSKDMPFLPGKKFVCKHCMQNFSTERGFERHECKEMQRAAHLKTPDGQAAFNAYKTWLAAQHRPVRTPDTFLASRYFSTFCKFILYARSVKLVNIELFIKLMVNRQMPPTLWMNPQVYSIYLEHISAHTTPMQHAQHTIDTLFDIAEEHGCDVSEALSKVAANDVIAMIRAHRLSPWILMFSRQFKVFLRERVTDEQLTIVESLIRPNYWSQQFKDNPDTVKMMKTYVQELGI